VYLIASPTQKNTNKTVKTKHFDSNQANKLAAKRRFGAILNALFSYFP
jgi:hypothetical protein